MKDEELKENENNKKKIVIPIVLTIIIIGCIVGLLLVIILMNKSEDNDNKSKKTTSTSTTELVIENKLPEGFTIKDSEVLSDLSKHYSTDWDCIDFEDSLAVDFNEKKRNEVDRLKFVKIENNKLMWKVENNWVQDSKVKDGVVFIDVDFSDEGEYDADFYVLTENNKMYKISTNNSISEEEFESFDIQNIEYVNKSDYSAFAYDMIDLKINIKNITYDEYSAGCSGSFKRYFFNTDKGIYVLDYTSKFVLRTMDEYLNDINIVYLSNQCGELNNDFVNINYKSESNILNNDGKKIKVKYYILYTDTRSEEKGEDLHILVDENDNVYSFILSSNNGFDETRTGFKPLKSKFSSFKEGVLKLKDGTTLNGKTLETLE